MKGYNIGRKKKPSYVFLCAEVGFYKSKILKEGSYKSKIYKEEYYEVVILWYGKRIERLFSYAKKG